MDRQSRKITALYGRLAHYHNDADTQSAYTQMETLLQYAKEHSFENPQFFCDWGYNGTDDVRPEYLRMLKAVVSGNVKNLVVLEFSRLGRDFEEVWKLISGTFPHYGVTFHSIQDGEELNKNLDTLRRLGISFERACRPVEEGGRK